MGLIAVEASVNPGVHQEGTEQTALSSALQGRGDLSHISDAPTAMPCPQCQSPRVAGQPCGRCGHADVHQSPHEGAERPSVTVPAGVDSLEAAKDLFPGYVVTRRVGAGGMGEVFFGHPEDFPNDLRALKTPHLALVQGSPQIAVRFRREAFAIQRVQSPHVVRVLDIGETRDGRPFLAMEWLEGRTLSEALEDPTSPFGNPFHPGLPSLAVTLAHRVAEALEAIHAQGVVHRDVKPSNIILCSESSEDLRPVLIDFGIARLEDVAAMGGTAGMALGTAENMPPEVARGDEPGVWTDVYLLAQVMYRVLSGLRRSTGQAKRLSRINPALPAGLDDVIEDGLADDPEDRPASPLILATRLAEALKPPAPPPTPPSTPPRAPRRTAPPPPARPRPTAPEAPQQPRKRADARAGNRAQVAKKPAWRSMVLSVVLVSVLLGGVALAILAATLAALSWLLP